MHSLVRRRKVRSAMPAVGLGLLLLAGLLALIARGMSRSRRRARRRALLAVPPEGTEPLLGAPAAARPDVAAVDELRERPRPLGTDEAARILGLNPDALASLNIPVTRASDGNPMYDSWEIVHWVEVLLSDPAGFEAATRSL